MDEVTLALSLMLSRVDESGCLSAGFMQGFFTLARGSGVFIGVVLMGAWRCPMVLLGYPDLGGWGQQGTAPLQQYRSPGISLPPAKGLLPSARGG